MNEICRRPPLHSSTPELKQSQKQMTNNSDESQEMDYENQEEEQIQDTLDSSEVLTDNNVPSSSNSDDQVQCPEISLAKSRLSGPAKKNIFPIFICVVVLACFIGHKVQTHKRTENEIRNCFTGLTKKYLKNVHILESLLVSAYNALNSTNTKSDVYLFLHYKDDQKEKIDNILKDASNCMNPGKEPSHMSLDIFNSINYGLIIENFGKRAKNSAIIVIENLNEIPYESARALHAICDVESPMEKGVIVALTMQVRKEEINDEHEGVVLENRIENILNNKWKELNDYELNALITRVTNNIFVFKSD